MNTNNEEKNENDLVDPQQNLDINSTNEEHLQEEKIENSPFDSEERLDLAQEEKSKNPSADEKQSKTIKTIVIVVLLLLPIAYIFYKTAGNSASTEQAGAPGQGIDITAYENAANSNPTFGNLLNLSNAYISSNMAAKAIEPLNKAIALNPKSAVAYSNLGLAYTIIQDYKKGIEAGEIAVQLDTSFLLAKNNLNWAKTEQNKLLDIIKELNKTPEKDRNNFYYLGLGLNYLKLQEYDKSIEVWNKILITEPKNSAALINIGVAYMSKLQYDNAVRYFQKAVEANSNDQLAKNNLAWALGEIIKADELAQKNKTGELQKNR